jgi:hypothetical protein
LDCRTSSDALRREQKGSCASYARDTRVVNFLVLERGRFRYLGPRAGSQPRTEAQHRVQSR